MRAFTFCELYTNETSEVRTIVARTDNLSARSMRHLDAWLKASPGRAICGFITIRAANVVDAMTSLGYDYR